MAIVVYIFYYFCDSCLYQVCIYIYIVLYTYIMYILDTDFLFQSTECNKTNSLQLYQL